LEQEVVGNMWVNGIILKIIVVKMINNNSHNSPSGAGV
jgi:hypothetical protein